MTDSILDRMELRGPQREQAVREARRQIADWGLVMPGAEPLVLEFGLGEFRKTGLIEFWVVNETQAGYCGKFMFVFDGQTCPYHHHDRKHETFFVLKGRMKMVVAGQERVVCPGETLILPPGTDHSFAGHGGNAMLLEVSMPSTLRDNFFADKRIGLAGVI